MKLEVKKANLSAGVIDLTAKTVVTKDLRLHLLFEHFLSAGITVLGNGAGDADSNEVEEALPVSDKYAGLFVQALRDKGYSATEQGNGLRFDQDQPRDKSGTFSMGNVATFKNEKLGTVAYVKPEAAFKYVGLSLAHGKSFSVSGATISRRDGTSLFVKFEGQPVPEGKRKPLGEGFGSVSGEAFGESQN